MEFKKLKRWTVKDWIAGGLIHLWLAVVVLIVIIPVMWVVSSAFSSSTSIDVMGILPYKPTLDNFKELFNETNYLSWYKNTLIVAVLTTIFTSILNMFTAFIFARFPFKGRKGLLMGIMLFQMFPSFLGLTAIYVICMNFGLLDNIYTLVLIYTAGSIPGNIFLARGYLLNVPRSLDEAAYIDGANKFQVFLNVVLPLSVPILSFLALTAFLMPWMDYIMPRMLLSHNTKLTLAIELYNWANAGTMLYNFPLFSAGSVLIALPIATLQIIFQRFLVTGITAGANKGE